MLPAAAVSTSDWLTHVDSAGPWRVEELAAGTYVTYGILDPRTGRFVYVGQSGDFAKRIAGHLKVRPERPHHRFRPIRAWIWDAVKAGAIPRFRVLDIYDTEEKSLASEALWVERLATEGHALMNRWREHQAIIRKCKEPVTEDQKK